MNVENKAAILLSKREFTTLFNNRSVTGVFPFHHEKTQDTEVDSSSLFTEHRELEDWVKFIASAEHCTNISHGGGGTRIEQFYVFTKKSLSFALLVEKKETGITLTKIDDKEALAPTFAYAYGVYVKEATDIWQLSEMDVTSYLLILHFIDIYRRMTYKSQLNYYVLAHYRMSLEEVMKHYKEALEAKDPRWLLPTFVFFSEVFAKFNIEIEDDSMQKLKQLSLISIDTIQNNKKIAIFEDKMIRIANCYHQHYINSSQIIVKSIIDNEVVESDTLYVYHTRLGNDLIWLKGNQVKLETVDLKELSTAIKAMIL